MPDAERHAEQVKWRVGKVGSMLSKLFIIYHVS